jgi:acetolactate synthase-1/3 small subunit
MTIVMDTDDATAVRVSANLYKLVNVLRVENVTHMPTVERDLALIKVKADATIRPQVIQLVDVFRARVVDVATDALIIESTGTPDKIDGLLEVLEPFGIVEMARTGIVAMGRGADAPTFSPAFVKARVPEEANGNGHKVVAVEQEQ